MVLAGGALYGSARPGRSIPTRIALIFLSLVLVGIFGFQGVVPYPNAGTWKKEFTSADFRNPEIEALIKQYKKTSFNSGEFYRLAEEISAKGADALPYIFRLKDDRKYLFIAGTHGLSLLTVQRVYFLHSTEVIRRIHDPAAVPVLLRHLNDVDMRIQVDQAYRASVALLEPGKRPVMTKDQVRDMLRLNMQPGLGIKWTEWLRLIANLPEPDRTGMFDELIKHQKVVGLWTVATDDMWSSGSYTPEDIKNIENFVDHLGSSRSVDVFNLLKVQAWGLQNQISSSKWALRKDQREEVQKSVSASIERDEALLNHLQLALLNYMKTAGMATLVWPTNGWRFFMDKNTSDNVLEFRIASIRPSVQVMLTQHNKPGPFIDLDGTSWGPRQIPLGPGKLFPYEGTFKVRAPKRIYINILADYSEWENCPTTAE